MDILGPQGVISKHTSDQLARLWPAPQDAEKAAHRAKTVRDTLRIVEAVLCLGVLFVLVRFVFAYLLKLG
ncbi:MAG: hypothetical protein ABSF17_15240 [Terracidiphilus sp.]|jgi:hypothetical protein